MLRDDPVGMHLVRPCYPGNRKKSAVDEVFVLTLLEIKSKRALQIKIYFTRFLAFRSLECKFSFMHLRDPYIKSMDINKDTNYALKK